MHDLKMLTSAPHDPASSAPLLAGGSHSLEPEDLSAVHRAGTPSHSLRLFLVVVIVAAVAAVCLSQSCSPQYSMLLFLGCCCASACSSCAPFPLFSTTCVNSLACRPPHVDGRAVVRLVPAHNPRHCGWDPRAFCRRLTGSCSPGDRLQHYKTGEPTHAATYSSFLVVWVVIVCK